jgi:hypothetical protein
VGELEKRLEDMEPGELFMGPKSLKQYEQMRAALKAAVSGLKFIEAVAGHTNRCVDTSACDAGCEYSAAATSTLTAISKLLGCDMEAG